jgi:hypothetical protein
LIREIGCFGAAITARQPTIGETDMAYQSRSGTCRGLGILKDTTHSDFAGFIFLAACALVAAVLNLGAGRLS